MRKLLASLVLGLAACQSTGSEAPAGEPYAFVFLETGPRASELDPTETRELGALHQQNIGRLGQEGVLLLAGPFGPQRSEPNWRGIYVFDVRTVEEAVALSETDPAVAAGAFALDTHLWRTDADLARVRELETARQESGETFTGRPYVFGLGSPAAEARAVLDRLAGDGLVPCAGELEMAGEATCAFLLSVDSPDEALQLLGRTAGGSSVGWQLSAWYGTTFLADLGAAE